MVVTLFIPWSLTCFSDAGNLLLFKFQGSSLIHFEKYIEPTTLAFSLWLSVLSLKTCIMIKRTIGHYDYLTLYTSFGIVDEISSVD